MKNLSAISKKGIIVISAVIMIMAGAFVALLPSTSQACGGGSMRSETGYIHVPMLNNTGKTMTIRRMFIDVPDYFYWHHSHGWVEDEIRVKAISLGGVSYYTTSTGSSHCHRWGNDSDKTITLDTVDGIAGYPFSGTKIKCKIACDVIKDKLPTGTGTDKEYTIRLYFRFDGDTEDRMNEIKFNL